MNSGDGGHAIAAAVFAIPAYLLLFLYLGW
jgi:hypothetical protein